MSLVGFKASNHGQQTAKRGARDNVDDRGTKWEFIRELEERFGKFTLDVAAASHNAKAPRYFTREDDGLTLAWTGNVWCNPPYSDCGAWVRKAWFEWNAAAAPNGFRSGNIGRAPSQIVMLLPANRVEQAWWQDLVEPFRDRPDSPLSVEFLRGRMRFDHPPEWVTPPKGDRPPFGLCLLIWSNPLARQTADGGGEE